MRYLIPAIALIFGVLIGMFLLSRFHKGIAERIGRFHAEGYWNRFGEELKRRAGTIKNKALGSSVLRWLIILLFVCAILLVLVGVVFFNDVLMFWSVFWWLSSSFSDSGMSDEWLTSAFALIAAVPLVIGIKYTLSLKWKNRRVGYGILCSWFLAYCGLMYQMNREIIWPPEGKCYTVTLYGKIKLVPCEWKVDPHYGTPVKPMTREVAYILNVEKYGYPVVSPPRVDEHTRLFAPDGTSLYCYYEREDGTIELFNMPCGAHPQFGNEAQTQPVNARIVERYFEQKERRLPAFSLQDSVQNSAQTESEESALERLRNTLESARVRNP